MLLLVHEPGCNRGGHDVTVTVWTCALCQAFRVRHSIRHTAPIFNSDAQSSHLICRVHCLRIGQVIKQCTTAIPSTAPTTSAFDSLLSACADKMQRVLASDGEEAPHGAVLCIGVRRALSLSTSRPRLISTLWFASWAQWQAVASFGWGHPSLTPCLFPKLLELPRGLVTH